MADGLSLILSVRDQADRLLDGLGKWHRALAALNRPFRMVVVDDGSADETPNRLTTLEGRLSHLHVVRHPKPRGFGAALRSALPRATLPLVAYATLDDAYQPRDLAALLRAMESPGAELPDDVRVELVNGFRAGGVAPGWVRAAGWAWRRVANTLLGAGATPPRGWLGWRAKLLYWLCWLFFGVRVGDPASGFKLMRRDLIGRFPVQSGGAFAHAEILAKATFLGTLLDEVPLSPRPEVAPPPPFWGEFRRVLSDPKFQDPTKEATAVTKIDAHHHLWRLDQFDYSFLDSEPTAAINRDFLPGHLRPLIQPLSIDATVLVQTQHNLDENRWALGLADQHGWIAGVVGWVDLASPDCEKQLLEFKDHPKFVGVRHIVQDEADDDFIVRDEVLRGLRVLEKHRVPYDLLFYVKHLPHAARLGEELPELPMVIDHLAKPRIKGRAADDWLPHLKAAARYPNMYCKLSGLVTEADWADWKPADLKPYVEAALEAFGPDRCMFGSDWPVCLLAADYGRVVAALEEALGDTSDEDKAKIFGGTAAKFYGLSVR